MANNNNQSKDLTPNSVPNASHLPQHQQSQGPLSGPPNHNSIQTSAPYPEATSIQRPIASLTMTIPQLPSSQGGLPGNSSHSTGGMPPTQMQAQAYLSSLNQSQFGRSQGPSGVQSVQQTFGRGEAPPMMMIPNDQDRSRLMMSQPVQAVSSLPNGVLPQGQSIMQMLGTNNFPKRASYASNRSKWQFAKSRSNAISWACHT